MNDRGMYRLEVRRRVRAPVGRVFEAWTEPRHIVRWWGPRGVHCLEASMDLRVGGSYRIVNELADGTRITISGRFEVVEPPTLLVYSWTGSPDSPLAERVTVTFRPMGQWTEITVRHELILDEAARDGHRLGWDGCLDGLETYVAGESAG